MPLYYLELVTCCTLHSANDLNNEMQSTSGSAKKASLTHSAYLISNTKQPVSEGGFARSFASGIYINNIFNFRHCIYKFTHVFNYNPTLI
jgi:hypothetical protein